MNPWLIGQICSGNINNFGKINKIFILYYMKIETFKTFDLKVIRQIILKQFSF